MEESHGFRNFSAIERFLVHVLRRALGTSKPVVLVPGTSEQRRTPPERHASCAVVLVLVVCDTMGTKKGRTAEGMVFIQSDVRSTAMFIL